MPTLAASTFGCVLAVAGADWAGHLRNIKTGKCIDVKDGRAPYQLQQWDCSDDSWNQYFSDSGFGLEGCHGSSYSTCVHSLAITGDVFSCQRSTCEGVGINADGPSINYGDMKPMFSHEFQTGLVRWYTDPAGQTNYCMDVKDGSHDNGALIQLWECDSSNQNQVWERVNYSPPESALDYQV
jgi:hypothetical protein